MTFAAFDSHRPDFVADQPVALPPSSVSVVEAGDQTLLLLPEKAVFLPDSRTLLVADAHFGKALHFRSLGVPVPGGTTAETLAVLTDLVLRLDVRRIVFLGDFLHSVRARAISTLLALQEWRNAHPALDLVLVRGNHDDRAGDPPASLEIEVVDEPLREGGLALCHHPRPIDGAFTLAGHLHPCISVGGRAHDWHRLACFWFTPSVAVLPAFGAFTGMQAIRVHRGERVFAVLPDRVAELAPRNPDRPTTVATPIDALPALIARAEAVLGRLEQLLPQPLAAPDWEASIAFRYRRTAHGAGRLSPVRHVATVRLASLVEVEPQKDRLVVNTEQFVAGRGANNVLLTGARGTGKSSLIKAVLNEFAPRGLRLIEVDKADLVDLPDIVDLVADRPERFVVFCDDLSFDEGEPGYKALKSILDGSVAQATENVLVYATSNRRHLLPEYMQENLSYKHLENGEVHPGEVVEEKISLSERFGLWISFYPFSQDEYLAIVAEWLRGFGIGAAEIEAARQPSLVWALERGSRSGRVAFQFAKDWAGRRSSA